MGQEVRLAHSLPTYGGVSGLTCLRVGPLSCHHFHTFSGPLRYL